VSSDYALSGDFGDQLELVGHGVVAGHQYRRIGGGSIATVYAVSAGKRPVVFFRSGDVEHEMKADQFTRVYERFRL
jgi:hypothetical protein